MQVDFAPFLDGRIGGVQAVCKEGFFCFKELCGIRINMIRQEYQLIDTEYSPGGFGIGEDIVLNGRLHGKLKIVIGVNGSIRIG